jgi:polyhydroxyalkanoate synthase
MTPPADSREPDPGLADAAEAAASPLDLLLTDAALGVLRRFVPSASTLRLAAGLARRPATVTRRGGTTRC